jgi:hypothetical protein
VNCCARSKPTTPAQTKRPRLPARRLIADSWSRDIAGKVLAQCHPLQRAYVADASRRVCALVGRGGGKTTGARARLLLKATSIYKAKLVYIATTRQQATDLMWFPLKDACEALGIEATFQEVALRCTIKKTGAQIRLVGADDMREIEKLRGQSFHEVQIDEAASYPTQLMDALLYRIIGPRLGDLDGVITMFGTPGHILAGPFYEATRTGGETHWSCHRWTLQDGAAHVAAMGRLWREALVEKAENGWGDDNPVWMREYLGLWAADNTTHIFRYRPHDAEGNPWNQWDPERTPGGLAKLPAGEWQYGYGLDLGSKDPFACNVFAFQPGDPRRRIYHVFGFERRSMYAQEIAKLLVGEAAVSSMMRGNGLPDRLGGLYGETGWPAAIVADLAGLGEAVIDELAKVYGIRIKAAEKKDKFGAFEVFNGDLVDGRMFVLKGSTLEQQLQTLQWRPDEYGTPKENKADANHSTDSAIYIRTELGRLFDASPSGTAEERRASPEPELEPIPDTEYSFLMDESAYGGL